MRNCCVCAYINSDISTGATKEVFMNGSTPLWVYLLALIGVFRVLSFYVDELVKIKVKEELDAFGIDIDTMLD